MSKAIEIMEKAIKEVENCDDTWRCNYSIGFRNGDVRGSSWEDKDLLDGPDKERVKELKSFGTKESLARQIVELENEVSKNSNPSVSAPEKIAFIGKDPGQRESNHSPKEQEVQPQSDKIVSPMEACEGVSSRQPVSADTFKGCGKVIGLGMEIKAKCGEYVMSWNRNVYCDECEKQSGGEQE